MYIIYALLAALFSGLTSVFAKNGINNIDSLLATFLRTIVISLFIFIILIFNNSLSNITVLSSKTYLFILLSGISNTLLWICYFKALALGDVSKVTPIDKTSIILTLLLSYILLHEPITSIKVVSMILILFGTFISTNKTSTDYKESNKWILYAVLTAIFTSTTTILSKIGLDKRYTDTTTFLRTLVVMVILTIIVISKKKYKTIKQITKKNLLFIILSGLTTSLSWLFYFKALSIGEASIVFPIEKLSLVVSIIFSKIFLKEHLSKKQLLGIIIIIVGTSLLMI